MNPLHGWSKSGARILVGIAVAAFAYLSVRVEANLAARHGVHLISLDSASE
jgi:hypothetical protein